MIRKSDIRSLLESTSPAHAASGTRDLKAFVRRFHHLIGLCDVDGNRFRTAVGHSQVRDPKTANGSVLERLKPSEFSLEHLGRGILGDDVFERLYNPDSRELAGLQRTALEAGEGAVGPSAFANINAFTASVAGLLEVSMLEGWQNPDFIGDKLMPDETSKIFEGRKVIGTGRIGDQAEQRHPGMPTKRVQFGERWITQPRTVENALACEVLQETVFLDLTGQVMQEANDVGTWLRYHDELARIDLFIGATNSYNYKGTAYNTYLSASTWDNDFSNELLHEGDVEEMLIKFRDMTDPETSTRVQINPNAVLVNREKVRTARGVMGDLAYGTEYRGNDAAGTPMNIRTQNSAYKGQFEILESPLVYERCVATAANGGLALSAANAAKYWWMFEKGKPFKNVVNWPFRVQTAAPGQLDMIDRGVVLYVKADVRSIPMVYEPRRVVRGKN